MYTTGCRQRQASFSADGPDPGSNSQSGSQSATGRVRTKRCPPDTDHDRREDSDRGCAMRLDDCAAVTGDVAALSLLDGGQPNESQPTPIAVAKRDGVLARQRYIARQHAFLDTVESNRSDRADDGLSAIDVVALTRNMPYMDADVLSLITRDDFRTVISRTGHNSTISSLAGILKENVDFLQNRIFSKKELVAYEKYVGSNPMFLLNKFKESGLIDYSASRTLNTIEDAHLYLKTNAKRFKHKSLLLSQYKLSSKNGHSVVLKYKVINDQPVKLLVDYQKPGLLSKNVPNPYRFDVHLDFEDFNFFVIYDIQKKYVNINCVHCSCKRL